MTNEKMLNTRILLKYDTLENWNKSTGILRAGEVAIATVPEGGSAQEVGSVKTPQVLVKVGDGKHTFAKLPYITAKAGDVYAWAKAEKLGKDAFSKEVNELFTNIENDITALEGKVGNSNVGDQINAAITAALKKLANGDAAKAHEFVTAAVQGEDGKVVVSRKALEAADIPVIEESQVNGLTEKLGNINTEIAGVKTTATENLAEAKGYADQQVKKLADGQVATNKAHIETLMGADTVEGSVAKALKDAKGYTDGQVSNAKTELQGYADQAEADALKAAKDYVDAEISAITGGGTGSLSALEKRVKANEDAIGVINGADTVEGSLAKVAKDAADAVDAEELRATNAETALGGRLDTVEAFFEAALEDGDGQQVIDTLKEIQDYIKSDETGASAMAASIKANTDAIEVINGEATVEGSLAKVAKDAAQAVTNEATRAKAAEEINAAAAKAADDKAVAAQGAVDALAGKVGTVAENKTVVEMIADAQAAATYDDAEVRGLIGANTTAISNEVTRATGAEKAINDKIGTEALTGGHTTLIAAINAANSGVSANAGEISGIKKQLAGITGDEGILGQAKAYTNGKIQEVNNTITILDGEVVKTVETANKSGKGEKVLDGKIENNKLTIEFDDTLTFVFNCGTSANLDPAQA